MTEYEWLTCTDNPSRMLQLLDAHFKDLHLLALRTCVAHNASVHTCEALGFKLSDYRCHAIREVVGNPFRPLLKTATVKKPCNACSRDWGHSYCGVCKGTQYVRALESPPWITSRVRSFARGITESGRYDDVPGLADVLEEEGCPDGGILRHLRQEVQCTDCMGKGTYWKKDHGGSGPFPLQCTVCKTTGWVPKPVPCRAGCWVLRLIESWQG